MAGPHLFSPYDVLFWASAAARRLALQRCRRCGTVCLAEGPLLINTVTPDTPDGLSVGAAVRLDYDERPDGTVLPTFDLLEKEHRFD